MDNLYFSKLAGISVPMHRVDYLQWKITYQRVYEIKIGLDGDEPSFQLISEDNVQLRQYLYVVDTKKEGLLVDEVNQPVGSRVEDFIKSDMLSELKDKQLEQVQELVSNIVLYASKVKSAQKSINNMQSIMSAADLSENEQFQEDSKKLRVRRKKLQKNIEDLVEFIENQNLIIHDEASIIKAREWDEWPAVETIYNIVSDDESEYYGQEPPNEESTNEGDEDYEIGEDVNTPSAPTTMPHNNNSITDDDDEMLLEAKG